MYHYRAKIERCIDGDTVQAALDVGIRISVTLRFRLYGIDTPERGKPGFKEATEYLENLLEAAKDDDGYVECRTYQDSQDKYGRYLIEFFNREGCSINSRMVETGHAVEYPK